MFCFEWLVNPNEQLLCIVPISYNSDGNGVEGEGVVLKILGV